MMNAETTSINFDKRPFGVRLLTAEPDGKTFSNGEMGRMPSGCQWII
ncbi:MAG: hypothetical protein ACOX6B_02265 [Thermoguttaceae bacterium]